MSFSRVSEGFHQIMASVFALLFFGLSIALTAVAFKYFLEGVIGTMDMVEGFIKTINMAVVSLATFELGLGVSKEYADHDTEGDILVVLRRSVPRFVSTVCIALVLEGLLMVIKYSQLDLAGNLYYPVAIISSAAILLMALGVFIYLTNSALDIGEQAQTARADRPLTADKRTAAGLRASVVGCPPMAIAPS